MDIKLEEHIKDMSDKQLRQLVPATIITGGKQYDLRSEVEFSSNKLGAFYENENHIKIFYKKGYSRTAIVKKLIKVLYEKGHIKI